MPEIFGIGVDATDIPRLAALRARHGEDLGRHYFLPGELAECLQRPNPDECLAARFAAKEAVMKALGTGWTDEVYFSGIEVRKNPFGKPEIILHGSTKRKAEALGAGTIHLSLTHAREIAIAYVIIDKG